MSLYVAGMCREALAKLALLMNEPSFSQEVLGFGNKVLAATQKKFWDATRKVYVCNKPWATEEGEIRYCDRSLGMAVLYDLNPNRTAAADRWQPAGLSAPNAPSVTLLANRPAELGISYPTNAVWRYWALSKGKRIDVLLNEFRDYWYNAPSVQLNNTLAEFLDIKPDTNGQWSHASIAPFFSLYMDIAGIRPLKPGYAAVEIAPQLGNIESLSITNYTVRGPIQTDFTQRNGQLEALISLPDGMSGTFVWKGKAIGLKGGANKVIA